MGMPVVVFSMSVCRRPMMKEFRKRISVFLTAGRMAFLMY